MYFSVGVNDNAHHPCGTNEKVSTTETACITYLALTLIDPDGFSCSEYGEKVNRVGQSSNTAFDK